MYRIGGRLGNVGASLRGVNLGIPLLGYWNSNPAALNRVGGHCQVGSLTGAVAS